MSEQPALDAFVAASLGDGSATRSVLADTVIARARGVGRLDVELLAAAALPRIFDRAALVAATASDAHDTQVEVAFARLVDQPFVHERGTGGWALHDSVRVPLLASWEAGELSEFDRDLTLARLIDHFVGEFDRGRAAHDALARVSALMRSADERRYRAALDGVEAAIVRPAIEAQHLALRRSSAHGRQRLSETIIELESARSHNLAESVLEAFELDIERPEVDDRPWLQHWVDYYGARLAIARRDWDRCGDYLDRLDDVAQIDPKLAVWTAIARADHASGLSRWDELLSTLESGIAFNDAHQADPYNASILWDRKAQALGQLWDWDGEVAASSRALELALEVGNDESAADHWCSLAASHDAAGAIDLAADCALGAMFLARTKTPSRRVNVNTTDTMMRVFGRRSRRLLHVAAAQSRHLRDVLGSEAMLEFHLVHAEVLAKGGARAAARAAFAAAAETAERDHPERIVEVVLARATSSLDPVSDDIDRIDHLLGTMTFDDPWEPARNTTNQAFNLLEVGRYDEAIQRARTARRMWEEMNHPRAIEFTHAIEGDSLRRLGDLEAARRSLEQAGSTAARGFDASAFEFRSRLAHDLADYDLAAQLASQAEKRTVRTETLLLVERMLLTAEYAARAGEFGTASDYATRAAERSLTAQRFAEWEPSAGVATADDHAGKAIAAWSTHDRPIRTRAATAREHLRAATTADPECGWFWLELAAVDLALDDERRARKHFGEAIERTSDPLTASAITRLRERLLGAGR